MLSSFWDDVQFPCRQIHFFVSKLKSHFSFKDNKSFICMLVVVPYELAFNLGKFKLIIIHFSNDSRRPMLSKL